MFTCQESLLMVTKFWRNHKINNRTPPNTTMYKQNTESTDNVPDANPNLVKNRWNSNSANAVAMQLWKYHICYAMFVLKSWMPHMNQRHDMSKAKIK